MVSDEQQPMYCQRDQESLRVSVESIKVEKWAHEDERYLCWSQASLISRAFPTDASGDSLQREPFKTSQLHLAQSMLHSDSMTAVHVEHSATCSTST